VLLICIAKVAIYIQMRSPDLGNGPTKSTWSKRGNITKTMACLRSGRLLRKGSDAMLNRILYHVHSKDLVSQEYWSRRNKRWRHFVFIYEKKPSGFCVTVYIDGVRK